MQIPDTVVVTKSFPQFQITILRTRGKRLHIGKRLHKPCKVRFNGFYPCLL